jgi:hypothetical protein
MVTAVIHRIIVMLIMDVCQDVGMHPMLLNFIIIALLLGNNSYFSFYRKYCNCKYQRYRPEVTQAQIDSVTKAYYEVQDKSFRNGTKYVKIVGGRTISTEGVENNFRNGFILTFNNNDGNRSKISKGVNNFIFRSRIFHVL